MHRKLNIGMKEHMETMDDQLKEYWESSIVPILVRIESSEN